MCEEEPLPIATSCKGVYCKNLVTQSTRKIFDFDVLPIIFDVKNLHFEAMQDDFEFIRLNGGIEPTPNYNIINIDGCNFYKSGSLKRLVYIDGAEEVLLKPRDEGLVPSNEKQVYNALDEISAYLEFYKLYIDSYIDVEAKEVVFNIGKLMQNPTNIKLWEYGIKNYGKWVADVNETQGYGANFSETNSVRWILTSDNKITITESERDIYPIKRRIFVNDDINQANKDALIELLNSRYNENLEIPANSVNMDFKTQFDIYVNRGEDLYKSLPCGELRYNSSGLYEVQIGFRYVGVDFI
jgi:hypothetical protein